MNSTYKLAFVVVLGAAILFSGCAKNRRRPLSLPQTIGLEKNGIRVKATRLSRVQAERTFGKRFPRKNGLEMIHLAVINSTNNACLLDTKNINLEIESLESTMKHIGHNTLGHALGWGIPGGCLLTGSIVAIACAAPVVLPFIAGLTGVVFIEYAAVYGADAAAKNNRLRDDLKLRMIEHDSAHWIYPADFINKVIFVSPKQFKSVFDLQIICEPDNRIETFSIDLR